MWLFIGHIDPRDWDFGGILKEPENSAADRRAARKKRREKSARLAATEPDSTFALDGMQSYAQVVAREANRAWGRSRMALLVGLLAFFPILIIVGACLLGALWRE